MKRIAVVILLLLVMAFGLLFAIENDMPVALNLLFVELPPVQLSLWLISAFALGGLLGVVASGVGLLRLRTRQAVLQRRLQRAERELDHLRTQGLKS